MVDADDGDDRDDLEYGKTLRARFASVAGSKYIERRETRGNDRVLVGRKANLTAMSGDGSTAAATAGAHAVAPAVTAAAASDVVAASPAADPAADPVILLLIGRVGAVLPVQRAEVPARRLQVLP